MTNALPDNSLIIETTGLTITAVGVLPVVVVALAIGALVAIRVWQGAQRRKE